MESTIEIIRKPKTFLTLNISQEIRASNVTLKTGNLASIWPTGDYKAKYTTFTGTGEDFLNITLVGSFITPLKNLSDNLVTCRRN